MVGYQKVIRPLEAISNLMWPLSIHWLSWAHGCKVVVCVKWNNESPSSIASTCCASWHCLILTAAPHILSQCLFSWIILYLKGIVRGIFRIALTNFCQLKRHSLNFYSGQVICQSLITRLHANVIQILSFDQRSLHFELQFLEVRKQKYYMETMIYKSKRYEDTGQLMIPSVGL